MSRAKRNNRIFTGGKRPVVLLLILLALAAAACLLVYLFIMKETKYVVSEPVYRFNNLDRIEYESGITLVETDSEMLIETKEGRETADSSPIYFDETAEMVLPEALAWIDPENSLEWQIPALTDVYLTEDNTAWAKNGKNAARLNHGVLYLASGTYVFLDDTTLTVNGKKYEITPLSFFTIFGETARLYEYESDEMTYFSSIESAMAESEVGYSLDLIKGTYTGKDGAERLLVPRPAGLKTVWE